MQRRWSFIKLSLLDTYYSFLKRDDDMAKHDWLRTLNKTPFTNKVIEAGIKLEEEVMACSLALELEKQTYKGSCEIEKEYNPAVLEAANLVKGATWQVRLKEEVTIADYPVLLYGRCDCILENCIVDIKYKSKPYKLPSYIHKSQHLMYMYLSGISNFKYLIVQNNALFIEDYYFTKETKTELFARIHTMLEAIMQNNEYKEIFLNKWLAKPSKPSFVIREN